MTTERTDWQPATPPDRPTGLPHLQPITDLPNTAGLHALAAEQRASRDAARSKQARENATAGQRRAARMAAQKAEADARQTSEQARQQAGREITAEFARLAEEARGGANGRVAGLAADRQAEGASMLICEAARDGRCDEDCHHAKPHENGCTCAITCHGFGMVPVGANCVPVAASQPAAQPPPDPLAGARRAAEVLVERGWDVGQDDNLRHKCPKCARAREFGWRYCPTCGERLRGTAVRDALEDLAEAIEAANAEHHARPERT